MGVKRGIVFYEIDYIIVVLLHEKHSVFKECRALYMTQLTLMDRDFVFKKSKIYIEVDNNRLLKLYVCRITDIIDTDSCLLAKM